VIIHSSGRIIIVNQASRLAGALLEKAGQYRTASLFNTLGRLVLFGFADFEHFSAASWAGALSGWPLVLHRNSFGILHFPLSPAFNTICFHSAPPIE
jgi:hypothetical protein